MTQTQSITKEKTMLPLNRLFDVSTQQISYNLLSIVYKSITVKYRVSLFFFCIARQSNCLCQSVLLSVSCVAKSLWTTSHKMSQTEMVLGQAKKIMDVNVPALLAVRYVKETIVYVKK